MMTDLIKSADEIAKMRIAGQLAARVLDMITPHVQVGITTKALDTLCHDYIVNELDASPSTLNHQGFPASICTSINQVICHGIPSERVLKNGDIINIDVTVEKGGYIGDTSRMYGVGKIKPFAKRLCELTKQAMDLAIAAVKPGEPLDIIGDTIHDFADQHRLSVVREFCGHGIGKRMWEAPQVAHFRNAGSGIIMKPGMIFTIEPMLNLGTRHIKQLPDGWTVVTRDRKLSAQWEHTILVTDDGAEILTLALG